METTEYQMRKNPHDSAGPLSKLLFLWTVKLFKVGSKKTVDIQDLFGPKSQDASNLVGDSLEKNWNAEVAKYELKLKQTTKNSENVTKPSLFKAVLKTFKWQFIFLAVIAVINDVFIRLFQPLLLGLLLSYFKAQPAITSDEAMYAAGGMIILNLISTVSINHYTMNAYHLGMKTRVSICSLIYRKSLKLSRTALGDSAPGKVVNLLSNDVNRFDLACFFVHYLWVGPVAAIAVLGFLFREIGLAGVLGIAVVFVVIPLQGYTGKLSARFRLQTAIRTDERVRLMDEIISGVQVIKMYTWEKPFAKLIAAARKLELKIVHKNTYVRALFMSFQLFTTRAATFCTMAFIVLSGDTLTADKVFVFAQYFAALSMTMSALFVRSIAETSESWVSLQRLQAYLLQEEVSKKTMQLSPEKGCGDNSDMAIFDNGSLIRSSDAKNSDTAIKITMGKAKWLKGEPGWDLEDINLDILKGKLVGIIGPVGSGKSSLLQAILGELPLEAGAVTLCGRLSYAAQEPWVFGSTVRQNILFGLPYDEFKYNEVVRVCSLQKDFQQFSHGDQTLVGEKGTSLSGGQKARINLARAVYRDADIYLLDDPLSAVDAHVGRHLYEQCIARHLRHRTRLLVTHQLHHLTDADHIIIMANGRIEMQGSYHSIATSSLEYARLLIPSAAPELAVDVEKGAEDTREGSKERRLRRYHSRRNSISSMGSKSTSLSCSYADLADLNLEEPELFEDKPQVIAAEASSKGVVKGSVGVHYMRAATNVPGCIVLVIMFLAAQAIASFFDYFVSYWTAQETLRFELNNTKIFTNGFSLNSTNDSPSPAAMLEAIPSQNTLVIVGGCSILLLLLVALLRAIGFYRACITASQRLHDLMFRGIIRSPMRFFDVTPSGRIMNRFSKDMGAVDELLPKAFLDATQLILIMIGTIVLAAIVNPILLVVVAVLGVVFFFTRKLYLKTSMNIKRLEGITRSPVFTHLGATLGGLSTIRVNNAQAIVQYEFDKLQDVHTSAFYMFISTMMAFGFSLDALCLVFVALVTFSFFLIDLSVLGDKVGLAITQAMSLSFMMQYGIRQSAEVANQLMAVERLVEYTQLPPEEGVKPDELDVKQARKKNMELRTFKEPPRGWPEHGKVEFHHVSLRYGQKESDKCVLDDLCFVIQPKEKVGIVGRTGAGKSSLIQALFRLAYIQGDILIDGVNTAHVTLEDLRKQLSIIPQDPMLFNGTLRKNLDPFEEYSDEKLWQVLDQVELKEQVSGPSGLSMHVLDGGGNFSVGQRQLICLARALLRNNRLLMMDEATANVDPHTDGLIQQTIRSKFTECTVLTIAHRLNTIMDSDKVLVMDGGKVVEFDHPFMLLQGQGVGHLRKMALETGDDNCAKLEEIARQAYFNRKLS